MAYKFELDQMIWYLGPDGVYSAPVLSRMTCENSRPEFADTEMQTRMWTYWGPAGVYYKTVHGVIAEGDCFISRTALAAAIADYKAGEVRLVEIHS